MSFINIIPFFYIKKIHLDPPSVRWSLDILFTVIIVLSLLEDEIGIGINSVWLNFKRRML
jgi:hypothetical protein